MTNVDYGRQLKDLNNVCKQINDAYTNNKNWDDGWISTQTNESWQIGSYDISTGIFKAETLLSRKLNLAKNELDFLKSVKLMEAHESKSSCSS